MALDSSKLLRDELDGVVYNKFKGKISIADVSHDFEFKIKKYHEVIKYKMTVER